MTSNLQWLFGSQCYWFLSSKLLCITKTLLSVVGKNLGLGVPLSRVKHDATSWQREAVHANP